VGDVKIDQSVIGSCTNGRIEDLKIAADILQWQRVNENIRCIVIPGTQDVYLEAMRRGYIEIFIRAGAVVSTPTCGPCLGGHMGVLADGEKAISTTNRNFVGRMGSTGAKIYLSNPAIAAASAILGRIASPNEIQN
jgi:3-isopropylmalate/(R)-2-methylmalate dehydratase large subunit